MHFLYLISDFKNSVFIVLLATHLSNNKLRLKNFSFAIFLAPRAVVAIIFIIPYYGTIPSDLYERYRSVEAGANLL